MTDGGAVHQSINVTPAIAKSLGLDRDHLTDALVASVTPDSPAAQAGIKQGDVIIAAGGAT